MNNYKKVIAFIGKFLEQMSHGYDFFGLKVQRQ